MRTEELEAFRAWLAAAVAPVPVYAGELPDQPDRCIAVADYPGPETPNWRTEPRVQIRMRSAPETAGVSPYRDVHELADAVDAVVAPPNQDTLVVDLAGRQAIVRKRSGPMPLGRDEKGRWEMTINVALDYARV